MEEKNRAWKTVSSKYLFRRPWLTVRCEDMLLPNGNHIPEYYILEYPDWVNTIAITKDGKFVFVRQYRPGIERTCYGTKIESKANKYTFVWRKTVERNRERRTQESLRQIMICPQN